VRTGGGGYHYYLGFDKDLKGTVALGGFEGVDVRARGGYVIAPPHKVGSFLPVAIPPTPVR
jgi:hypothetical protein